VRKVARFQSVELGSIHAIGFKMSSSIRRRTRQDGPSVKRALPTRKGHAGASKELQFDAPVRVDGARWLSRYQTEPEWTPNVLITFLVLCLIRVLGALTNGIADCDETYNYWEPLHFLLYGKGLQTWEYSPTFAIRSYAFLYPFAAVARTGSLALSRLRHLVPVSEKIGVFYAVRIFQAIICAIAETALYDATVYRFGSRVSRVFLAFTLLSPGMFRASTELLPSSFAMISFMLATSQWLLGRFSAAVSFVAISSLLGWPFAALLGVPVALHAWYARGSFFLAKRAAISGFIILSFMVPIDSWHFGKLVIAPLNIVLYNVFPKDGAGPNIFGTEPLSFYISNLLLNWNVAFALLVSFPLLAVIDILPSPISGRKSTALQDRMARFVYFSPCLLWLGVFFNQEHKEERFLVPVYPLIALIGAVALDDWCLLCFGHTETVGKGRRIVRSFIKLGVAAMAVVLGMSRIHMQVVGFGAPISIFKFLSKTELGDGSGPRDMADDISVADQTINICLGNEWYRFPSSFFLPKGPYEIKFVRSSFTGLLPKYFAEGKYGTRYVPRGMNMFNKEDPEQYVSDLMCHYFVDLDLSHRRTSEDDLLAIQPRENAIAKNHSVTLVSRNLLDTEYSKPGFRAFSIPFLSGYTRQYRAYGRLQLSRNIVLLPFAANASLDVD
jgi:alpha-1,2-mannosyltransferase